jgi:hypothetical protein
MAVRNKNQLINGHRDPMAAEIVIPLRKGVPTTRPSEGLQ